ncbi:MAG: hypothetical protein QNJ19_03020 [Woeseiaceae bacterium]|nr:hypothetical protein [Woeseiaceae bacterium]
MLTTLIGVIVVILGLICWVGQTMAVFFLPTAIKLGLFEPEHEVDPSMYLFERMSQGIMDVLLTWILPLAALLMILGHPSWPVFALVGGGIYLYFPGVFMITRIVLKQHSKSVGRPSSVRSANMFGSLWILSAITMIVLAILELSA